MDDSRRAEASVIRPETARRIPIRSISLSIVVAVVLYVGMTTLADWEELGAAFSALPGALWGQVVVLSLLSYLCRFTRWHHFIGALGHKVPILCNLEIYLAAFALTLTPGKAGETIRSVFLNPYGVSYSNSIGAFVSERLLDLVVVGALASLALSLFPEQQQWMFAAIACALMLMLLVRSRLINLIGGRVGRSAVFTHTANLVVTVRLLLSGCRLLVAAPLSLAAWSAQGVSLYLIVAVLGYEMAADTAVAIYCLSILAGAVTFIPGGLGATEVAIVLLLSRGGLSLTDAITASLVSRSLTLWLAVAIGLVAMSRLAVTRDSAVFDNNCKSKQINRLQ